MSPETPYPTPEDAETAFYEAIEAASLDDLMKVWADDDEIVCVFPGGHRLVGPVAIRAAWREMFSQRKAVQVRLANAVHWAGPMLAIHNLVEAIQIDGEALPTPIAATNVFVRGPAGWRLLVHHASPVQAGPTAGGSPHAQTLH